MKEIEQNVIDTFSLVDSPSDYPQGLVEKMLSNINDNELEYLKSVFLKLKYAKVETDVIDDYPDVTSNDLQELLKELVWENSDDWSSEMSSVAENIFYGLNTVELNAMKKLMIEVNKLRGK